VAGAAVGNAVKVLLFPGLYVAAVRVALLGLLTPFCPVASLLFSPKEVRAGGASEKLP
tara:strand:- start:88 stop:261 length:174 start_codon:yes stop_codon:yes gene_type:complete